MIVSIARKEFVDAWRDDNTSAICDSFRSACSNTADRSSAALAMTEMMSRWRWAYLLFHYGVGQLL